VAKKATWHETVLMQSPILVSLQILTSFLHTTAVLL